MVTFEEAYKKAKEIKSNINTCTEFEKGFVFGCTDDEDCVGGLETSPCVITKKEGKAISMAAFVMKGTGKEIDSFDI